MACLGAKSKGGIKIEVQKQIFTAGELVKYKDWPGVLFRVIPNPAYAYDAAGYATYEATVVSTDDPENWEMGSKAVFTQDDLESV